jgi:hypothetical protein
MALAANLASVQILHDDAQRVVAKFQFFQHTANTGSHENSVIKINADALMGRTQFLTQAIAGAPPFIPGEKLTANGGSGAVGYFIGSDAPLEQNIYVVLAGTTPFANDDSIYSESTHYTLLVDGSGAADGRAPAKLELRSLAWSIAGNTATRVALEWAGSPNVEIVQMGTGQGYLGRNNLGISIPNNASTPTGHVNITTYSTPALSGYTIIAEFVKGAGFERIPNGA